MIGREEYMTKQIKLLVLTTVTALAVCGIGLRLLLQITRMFI